MVIDWLLQISWLQKREEFTFAHSAFKVFHGTKKQALQYCEEENQYPERKFKTYLYHDFPWQKHEIYKYIAESTRQQKELLLAQIRKKKHPCYIIESNGAFKICGLVLSGTESEIERLNSLDPENNYVIWGGPYYDYARVKKKVEKLNQQKGS